MSEARAHPVLDLLQRRVREGSVPGRRGTEDRHRLGLAIEGGGLSGVVTAGMVTALEHLGVLEAFDAVYGTSAGAYNGAYLLAGQAAYGTTIYYEEINSRRFYDPLRFVVGRPVLSVEFLVDEVVTRRKPLDLRAVLDAPVPLGVVVTPVEACRHDEVPASRVVGGFRSGEELLEALRAAAVIPVLGGPPLPVDGGLGLDGGAVEPIPFRAARRDGCTHVLALLSSPEDYVFEPLSRAGRAWVRWRLRDSLPGLCRAVLERRSRYAADKDRLRRESRDPEGQVLAVAPELPSAVSRSEKRRDVLIDGAGAGAAAVFEVMEPLRDLRPFPESPGEILHT